jgi:TetR/AcrR family transcriptional repressor of nem operon
MTLARATAQAYGYNGLSFRELAKAVGVKSASIHYHFPTKSDLGAALAQRYREEAVATLEGFWAECRDPIACLRKYTALFRLALENGNRMCMCGFMAAEHADLPEAVRIEVEAFGNANVTWLAGILSTLDPGGDPAAVERRALAIFAGVGGAQLAARSRNDLGTYDAVIDGYRASGLIPD